MTPVSDAECRKFTDLVKRALCYYCLDDQYLQKELCELEEVDTNFKKYFDQACIAEQKRKSFQEIGMSGAKLDPSSGVSISKVDTSRKQDGNGGKKSGGSFNGGKKSGGSFNGGKGSRCKGTNSGNGNGEIKRIE